MVIDSRDEYIHHVKGRRGPKRKLIDSTSLLNRHLLDTHHFSIQRQERPAGILCAVVKRAERIIK